MWEKLHRVGLVAFLALVVYVVVYNATPHYGKQPSGDMYLSAEQWQRVADRIEDLEKVIEKNGLPVPGNRLPK